MPRRSGSLIQQLSDLTQKLRRQEIHLARLKTKQKRAIQSTERLKIRLGDLFYQVNPRALNDVELQRTIVDLADLLRSNSDIESYRTAGEEWLKAKGKSEKPKKTNKSKSTAEERQQQLNNKTKSGELMLRCQLHHYDRPTLLGAILALHVN